MASDSYEQSFALDSRNDEDDKDENGDMIVRNDSRISDQGFNSKREMVAADDDDDENHDDKNHKSVITLGVESKDDDNDDDYEASYKVYLASKDQLVQHYHKATAEFHEKQELNLLLQRKLADHYKRKKGSFDDDTQQQQQQQQQQTTNNIDDDVNQMDIDKQYLHKLDEYKKRMDEYAGAMERHKNELNDYSDTCRKVTLRDFEELLKFAEFKKQTCSQFLQHKKDLIKEIERKLAIENDKDREIKQLRLEHYKLLYKVLKRSKLVKDSERLSGGLRILDFEQLKIENQTYKEKIEERNEDLQKLSDKRTKSIVILTHCNEKSFHVENSLKTKTNDLHSIEKNISLIRDELTHLKIARDNLRKENSGLKSGLVLLENKRLIRDFQGCAEKNGSLNADLLALKNQYNDLLARMKTVC
ncbi:hypothetical protein HELRODRAFT_164675 [Helobdella robusta]|uniref:CCDC113/CCDC96 coiled-coil domain-containing protein n=1 Tax=Helobdella robusta TaxID=6412 RepID=T1EVP8_HELRO|nr:hypothetical protein HELRODRAFT_164675 [Helobdella robusta]ESN92601.1 hypothetical protein HELRODRAFT_164675 [Helobdella robusta]